MLNYLGTGLRWYAEKPVKPIQRRYWEFQAVVSGQIAPLFPTGPDNLRKRTLWLFPVGNAHGWVGEPGLSAEVVVFQFLTVPEPLGRLVRSSNEFLRMSLTDAQCRRLRELSRNARRYWKRPSAGMMLCQEHILLELSVLLYESTGRGDETGEPDAASKKVNQALDWFNTHMEENPGMEALAQAVSVSTSHLRRLFHDVLQASPKKMLDQLRFQRAEQLMADPTFKLSSVGDACGFGSPSAFSRAFKSKFGVSPEQWRA